MSTEYKTALVMNLMYNLLLAVVFSTAAHMMSMGDVSFPAILLDILMAYVLEMIIALCLPFSKWGTELAGRYAESGTLKYRGIMTTGTAVPFAVTMCLGMSFIGSVVIAHLPVVIWIRTFGKMLPVFMVMGWILSFILVPVCMGVASKIVNR